MVIWHVITAYSSLQHLARDCKNPTEIGPLPDRMMSTRDRAENPPVMLVFFQKWQHVAKFYMDFHNNQKLGSKTLLPKVSGLLLKLS